MQCKFMAMHRVHCQVCTGRYRLPTFAVAGVFHGLFVDPTVRIVWLVAYERCQRGTDQNCSSHSPEVLGNPVSKLASNIAVAKEWS